MNVELRSPSDESGGAGGDGSQAASSAGATPTADNMETVDIVQQEDTFEDIAKHNIIQVAGKIQEDLQKASLHHHFCNAICGSFFLKRSFVAIWRYKNTKSVK